MELETTSNLGTSDAPCNIDSEYSYSKEGTDKLYLTLLIVIHSPACFNLQCQMEAISRLYMEKELYQHKSLLGDQCLNANNTPCWVPQIKDILDAEIQEKLKKCPTIWDYYCELNVLHHAIQISATECIKPCKTSQYKLSLDKELSLSGDYGLGSTVLTLRFSTNTITNYKEVWVRILNILKNVCICLTRNMFMQVMDASTIVGSVGGSLGLFLGFSCLATIQAILQKL